MKPHRLSSPSGLTRAFFDRHGGVSEGIYASAQFGWGASDDSAENVAENRRRAEAVLGVPIVTVHQCHSADVTVVTEPFGRAAAPATDALATDRPGIGLGVLTADCAPVLFHDAAAGVIGAAHAGWKGALGGVLENTVAAMKALGATRIEAAIGPCISQPSYQVDEAYRARFVEHDGANARFFAPDGERFRFDLPGYVAARLAAIGVPATPPPACTYADEKYFSNRRAFHRGEGDYGRGLSVIALTP